MRYIELIVIISVVVFCCDTLLAQIQPISGVYTTFDGRTEEVYLFEGESILLLVEKNLINTEQLIDPNTIPIIVNLIDGYYEGFVNLYGIEPNGGNPEYGYKVNIFFGQPSCGAACGLIGNKGVEVGGAFWDQIYNEVKFKTNTHNLSIVGYEFGRNFFSYSNKILFPYSQSKDERNGGFAEGFANLGYLEAFREGVSSRMDIDQRLFQETDKYLNELNKLLIAYINDSESNPFNSLLKQNLISDINRNSWGFDNPSYLASGILVGTYSLLKKPNLQPFIEVINSRQTASSVQYALGTVALGFSRAVNLNLSNYFRNVLKFDIDPESEKLILELPEIDSDYLIKDLSKLYFTSPLDSINLLVRSINYDTTNSDKSYRVKKTDEILFQSASGNFNLNYAIFGNLDSVQLNVEMLNNGIVIDSYEIDILKRKKIILSNLDSHLYSYRGLGKVSYSDGEFIIENISSRFSNPQFDNNIILKKYPLVPNRRIKLSGEIKNIRIDDNESSCNVAIGGRFGSHGTNRVGLDVGRNDSINFYTVDLEFNINDYFFKNLEQNALKYLSQEFWLSSNNSNCVAKNVVIKDVTDLDDDGIADFDDNCPVDFNPSQKDENLDGIGDKCDKLSVTCTNEPSIPIWVNPPSNTIISCANANNYVIPILFYTNNETGDCLISGSLQGIKSGYFDECGGNINVDWDFTDSYGRNIHYTQPIIVLPAATSKWVNPPNQITITCEEAQNYVIPPLSYSNNGIGECRMDGSVPGTIHTGSFEECGGSLVIKWEFIDECNNTIIHYQTIKIETDNNRDICLEEIDYLNTIPPIEWQNADCDGDGELNYIEAINGSNPYKACSNFNDTLKIPQVSELLIGDDSVNVIYEESYFDSIRTVLIFEDQKGDSITSTNNNVTISNLNSCTNYSIIVKVFCGDSSFVNLGEQIEFKTTGCSVTSVVNSNKTFFNLYPNPFTSTINIEIEGASSPTDISIYSIQGQLIRTLNKTELNSISLDLSNLESGVYVVKVVGKDFTESRRLVKSY